MESRCIVIFEGSCKSKATYKVFKFYLDKFLEWSKLDYESLFELKSIETENIIQDYTMYLKRRVSDGEISPNSIPDMNIGTFKFLKSNRKKIDRESITQLYPDKVKLQGGKAITDDEIRQLLEYADKRETAIIHMSSATGSRPEALAELQMKSVSEYENGFTKLILYAGDFKHETITFLHPEASHALNEYLEWRKRNGEKITDDSYVISTIQAKNKIFSKKLRSSDLQVIMNRLFKESGIARTKQGRRFDLATFTGFRKRFNTRLELNSRISLGAIQCLMDHTGYLSRNYRKPTEEELFREYKKAVNDLIVSKEWKLKQELDESKKENIVEKDKRISVLESTLKQQEIMLNELMKKIS